MPTTNSHFAAVLAALMLTLASFHALVSVPPAADTSLLVAATLA